MSPLRNQGHLASLIRGREIQAKEKAQLSAQLLEVTSLKPIRVQLLHRNVQRFRGGLVFKAHRLCVSLNSRLESNKEEEEEGA